MIHHSRGQPFGGAVRVLDLRLAILCAEGPRLSLLHPANAGESRKKKRKTRLPAAEAAQKWGLRPRVAVNAGIQVHSNCLSAGPMRLPAAQGPSCPRCPRCAAFYSAGGGATMAPGSRRQTSSAQKITGEHPRADRENAAVSGVL